jgi:hypothetical protein
MVGFGQTCLVLILCMSLRHIYNRCPQEAMDDSGLWMNPYQHVRTEQCTSCVVSCESNSKGVLFIWLEEHRIPTTANVFLPHHSRRRVVSKCCCCLTNSRLRSTAGGRVNEGGKEKRTGRRHLYWFNLLKMACISCLDEYTDLWKPTTSIVSTRYVSWWATRVVLLTKVRDYK